MNLRQQRVAVIGGTSGIGLAVARAAMNDGANVVVGSSSPQKVDGAVGHLPGVESFAVDVRDEASVAAFFERIGSLDHLVYTAGDWDRSAAAPIEASDLARATHLFTVRFWGAAAAVKHAVKHLAPSGSITLTDGMIAHRPRKGTSVSSAMAGAIEHFARALAVELAPIRVNAVCPGFVLTEVWNSIPASEREGRIKQMTERQLIKRAGSPAEVAEAYLYLMRGGFTTGQVLYVDGGMPTSF